MRKLSWLLAVVALLSACGGPSEEDRVRSQVEAFGQAVAAKDYSRLCDEILSADLLAKLMVVGRPCSVALAEGFGPAVDPTVEILEVDVRSERVALAKVRTDAANQAPSTVTLRMVKEAGQWRVGSLAGQPPPPPDTPAPPAPVTPGQTAPAPGSTAPSPGGTPAPSPGGTPAPSPGGTTAPAPKRGTTTP